MGAQDGKDPLDRSIADLARRQHGVVARNQLDALGLTRRAIGRRIDRGWLHGVHRGVYAVGHLALTRNGRYMAAVLACGDGAALSHFSAAVLWGILDDRGGPIHVTVEGNRVCPGVIVHRSPLQGDRVRRHGIVVTTVSRTLVDLADVVRKRRTLARAFDEAEYLGLDWQGAAPIHGRRGSGLLASVLAFHEPGTTRTLSELEERFLAFCESRGFRRPEVNVSIDGYLCDFVWREERLIVETDGHAAHGTRRAKERDAVRDADLQIAGWRVVRVTWQRLFGEEQGLAGQLRRLLATPAPAAPGAPRPRSRFRAARPRRPRP
jgi:very-short-patch-repair endonuclease